MCSIVWPRGSKSAQLRNTKRNKRNIRDTNWYEQEHVILMIDHDRYLLRILRWQSSISVWLHSRFQPNNFSTRMIYGHDRSFAKPLNKAKESEQKHFHETFVRKYTAKSCSDTVTRKNARANRKFGKSQSTILALRATSNQSVFEIKVFFRNKKRREMWSIAESVTMK